MNIYLAHAGKNGTAYYLQALVLSRQDLRQFISVMRSNKTGSAAEECR